MLCRSPFSIGPKLTIFPLLFFFLEELAYPLIANTIICNTIRILLSLNTLSTSMKCHYGKMQESQSFPYLIVFGYRLRWHKTCCAFWRTDVEYCLENGHKETELLTTVANKIPNIFLYREVSPEKSL